MAPTIKHYRFWCTDCKDFTLHNSDDTCRICGTVTKEYNLFEIPEEKILEQRKRYKQSLKNKSALVSKYGILANFFNPGNQLTEMFNEDWNKPEIVEDDAGQKVIDEEEHRIRNNEMIRLQEEYKKRKEEYQKFKNLGRNDICACGSGKKYKKCCIDKFKDLK